MLRTAVPKAAAYVDGDLAWPEDDIGTEPDRLDRPNADAVPQTFRPQQLSKPHLRLGIPSAVRQHGTPGARR